MNWKLRGRNWSWPNLKHPYIFLEGLMTTTKKTAMKISVPAKIRTGCVPNTNQGRYILANLFGFSS
jgi:hypothetical protein